MKASLKPGLKHRMTFTVPENKTVPHLYPEAAMFQEMPKVFATGYMVGLFEWACIELIRSRVGDAPVYVTFDLDCLDPSVAPAVSNLEPAFCGWTVDQAFGLLRGLRGLDVIGGDVVCLMPTKDAPNGITAQVATAAAFELVGLIADRLAGGSA